MEPYHYWYNEVGDMSQFGDFYEHQIVRWLNETFPPPHILAFEVKITPSGKTSKWVAM